MTLNIVTTPELVRRAPLGPAAVQCSWFGRSHEAGSMPAGRNGHPAELPRRDEVGCRGRGLRIPRRYQHRASGAAVVAVAGVSRGPATTWDGRN